MLLKHEFEHELTERGWTPDISFCWSHVDYPWQSICSRPVSNLLGQAFVNFQHVPYAEVIKRLEAGTLFPARR